MLSMYKWGIGRNLHVKYVPGGCVINIHVKYVWVRVGRNLHVKYVPVGKV